MRQPIDQKRTGMKLKMMLTFAGYDVKFIQKYLNLACPQSIYRWFQGKALPSVDHLCAISVLLDVHIEDLLVLQGQSLFRSVEKVVKEPYQRRVFSYEMVFQRAAWCN